MEKLFAFLYTNKKLLENLKKQSHLHCIKNKKIGINLNKEVKDPYTEN